MSARLLNTTNSSLVYDTAGHSVDSGAAVFASTEDPVAMPLIGTGRLVVLSDPTPTPKPSVRKPKAAETDSEEENA